MRGRCVTGDMKFMRIMGSPAPVLLLFMHCIYSPSLLLLGKSLSIFTHIIFYPSVLSYIIGPNCVYMEMCISYCSLIRLGSYWTTLIYIRILKYYNHFKATFSIIYSTAYPLTSLAILWAHCFYRNCI